MKGALLLAQPISSLGSKEHGNKGNFETLSHKLCEIEHRGMNHSLNLFLVLAYHYAMMKAGTSPFRNGNKF